MTSFARTPEGRAAAERMMKEFGHTMGPFKPRPGFPGRSPATSQAQNLPQQTGTGMAGLGQANLQHLQSLLSGTPAPTSGTVNQIGGNLRRAMDARSDIGMQPAMTTNQTQGMLQGAPIGGNPRQIAQLPQQPTGRSGRGTTPATPPSFASQMGGMGLAGMGLQQKFGQGMKKGGAVKKKASSYKSGGSVSSASKRADGCAIKGKTRGKIV